MSIIVKTGFESMDMERVMALLKQTYWADKRSRETMEKAMRHSDCYGAFDAETGEQVGFARIITDETTFMYLCDVIVDEKHRGCGAGRAMMEAISGGNRYKGMRGLLLTSTAAGLYEKYGFMPCDRAMYL